MRVQRLFLSPLYSNNVYTCIPAPDCPLSSECGQSGAWLFSNQHAARSAFSPLQVGSDTSGMLRGSCGQALCTYVCVGEWME